jgi:hypothetical protein
VKESCLQNPKWIPASVKSEESSSRIDVMRPVDELLCQQRNMMGIKLRIF